MMVFQEVWKGREAGGFGGFGCKSEIAGLQSGHAVPGANQNRTHQNWMGWDELTAKMNE